MRRLQVPRSGPGAPFPTITEALALNAAVDVVGDYRDPTDGIYRGFLFDGVTKAYTTIHVPGSASTTLLALNNVGQLLGRTVDTAGVARMFLYDVATSDFTFVTIPGLDLARPGRPNR